MNTTNMKTLTAIGLVALGAAVCAAGIYVGSTDDAPGAALIGIAALIASTILAIKTARRKV